MNRIAPGSRLDWDWFHGTIPENAWIDETAFIETTFSFRFATSGLADAITVGRGAATYLGTMFDLGEHARVTIGDYAFVHGVWFISDASIEIGDYSMLSWNVVLMDTYRSSPTATQRRRELEAVSVSSDRRIRTDEAAARPIRIGTNVWVGFDVVVLPGVTIGNGAVVGAKSVVFEDVPPYAVAAGNPARVIRRLDPTASLHG